MIFWARDTRIPHSGQTIGPFECLESRNPCLANCYRMKCFTCITFFFKILFLYHTKCHPNICFHSEVSKTFQKNKPSEELGGESRALPFLCSGSTEPGKQRGPVQKQQDCCFVFVFEPSTFGGSWRRECEAHPARLPCEPLLYRMHLVLQKLLKCQRNIWANAGKDVRKTVLPLWNSPASICFNSTFKDSGWSIKSWQV